MSIYMYVYIYIYKEELELDFWEAFYFEKVNFEASFLLTIKFRMYEQ